MFGEYLKRSKKRIGRNVFGGATVFLGIMMTSAFVAAEDAQLARVDVQPDQMVRRNNDLGSFDRSSPEDVVIEEGQVVAINNSLKNVIEENQRLSGENQKLESEIQRMREEYNSTQKLYADLRQDRDSLADSVKHVRSSNRQYSQKIKELEENIKNLETSKEPLADDQLAYNNETSLDAEERYQEEDFFASEGTPLLEEEDNDTSDDTIEESPMMNDIQQREDKTLDLLTKIDAFAEGDERLRTDSARAHYNMGNIYFQKGEFELAAREYYQAVTLMPNDPDVHYNLAFVSGEHLRDYRTALKHYQMYLYLNPKAQDKLFVKEKILHAKLALSSLVDSPLDKDK